MSGEAPVAVGAPSSHRLASLFAPRGVVVIGASRDPSKLGAAMMRSVSNTHALVAGVNPHDVDPLARRFGTVAEASDALGQFDLAVLCLPAVLNAQAMRAAADAGVRAAIVCSGGFAEAGPPGARLQAELVEAAQAAGVALLGPNTSGFLNPTVGLTASFVPGAAVVRPGHVAIVAASGGLNHALAFQFAADGIGLSLAVGLGNAADVTAAEILAYLGTDGATAAIALHIEAVSDGPGLTSAIRAVTERIPVVALVVGEHDLSDFARSHTGALATSWRVTRAALGDAGAVLVDDERNLVDAVTALSAFRLKPRLRPSVGVITGQAGPGLLHADGLARNGVEVPALADETRQRLAELLPAVTYQGNPVDTGRPTDTFAEVVSAVAHDPAIDLVSVYALVEEDSVEAVLEAVGPIDAVVGTAGPASDVARVRDDLRLLGVPVVTSPSALTTAVTALVHDSRALARTRRRAEIDLVPSAPVVIAAEVLALLERPALNEDETKTLLASIGIQSPPRRVCGSPTEAHRAFGELSRPVAVKLLDAAVLHKSDVGGVVLDISTRTDLDGALSSVRAAGAERYLIESMVGPGVDLIVGAVRDPVFGPMVLVGFGGVMTEVLADVVTTPAPVRVVEATELLDGLKAGRVLDGYRGQRAVDRFAIGRIVSALGDLIAAHPRIESIEINPLRVIDGEPVALDAVVTFVEEVH